MESGKWSGYLKIVQPKSLTTVVSDNTAIDGSSYTNYSWYNRLVHGSASRLARYQEFDTMDNDVDISRGLDLVSEEMTNKNSKTNLPINIDIYTGEHSTIPTNVISTLRVALKHYCKIHRLDTKLYQISRNLIKYGDVFFRKVKQKGTNLYKWEHIAAKNVLAAAVDETDVTKIVAYQIRKDIKIPTASIGGMVTKQENETELVPCGEILRFTLNDDMSESAPFGESPLSCVYRVQKQKELLESAIVIYRVQRAPERRVFYIDVGKMPPQRTKVYLEQIKNEIRQKKIPSMNGGSDSIESTYNPQSMNEDFYFAQRPGGGGSRVETLPAGQNLGELTDLEYFRQKVMEGLRIPPSYLPNMQDSGGAIFTDGQPGAAYMQEIQFAKYVERLQAHVNESIDADFKQFLRDIGISVDETLYGLSLPKPTNFERQREIAIDSDLLTQFGNADGISYLSKRFILTRYLRLTPDELAMNESLLRQERGISPKNVNGVISLYNPDLMDIGSSDSMSAGGSSVGSSMTDFTNGDSTEAGDIDVDGETSEVKDDDNETKASSSAPKE